MGSRLLLVVRRRVSAADSAVYDEAWSRFREAALGKGAKAWRFRSTGDAHEFLEFLEFSANADPREDEAIRAAVAVLDGVSPAATEEWEDAPVSE